jgi:hypothetical protein
MILAPMQFLCGNKRPWNYSENYYIIIIIIIILFDKICNMV